MNRNKKRLLSCCTAVLLTLTLFSACGNGNTPVLSIGEKAFSLRDGIALQQFLDLGWQRTGTTWLTNSHKLKPNTYDGEKAISIGGKNNASILSLYLKNTTEKELPINECTVYKVKINLSTAEKEGKPVLVNGENYAKRSLAQTKDLMKGHTLKQSGTNLLQYDDGSFTYKFVFTDNQCTEITLMEKIK